MRVECPRKDDVDIQATQLEENIRPLSPEDLYKQIRIGYPMFSDFVVPVLPSAVRANCNVVGVFRMTVPYLYKVMSEFACSFFELLHYRSLLRSDEGLARD